MAPPPSTTAENFDALYGLRIRELDDGRVRAEVEVRDQLKHGQGWVHGGVYAAIAESIALLGTATGSTTQGGQAIPESNQMSFLRPITAGSIHAGARVLHRGRTTWVWEIEISDDRQQLCALARTTVALRTDPGSSPQQDLSRRP